MELKYERSECGVEYMRSNRTFMELKSHKKLEATVQNWCSNRTFMELK